MHFEFLNTYPKDGNHLELINNLPCRIIKGADPYHYTNDKGELRELKRCLWYVLFDEHISIRHSNGFKTAENAFKWAVNEYNKYLKQEIKRIKSYYNDNRSYVMRGFNG